MLIIMMTAGLCAPVPEPVRLPEDSAFREIARETARNVRTPAPADEPSMACLLDDTCGGDHE